MSAIMSDLLTLADASAELGVAHDTLRWQVHNGKLKAQKLGTSWVVTRREVERYRRENQRVTTAPIGSGPVGLLGGLGGPQPTPDGPAS
jgi:excisionase family DNA binding protein